MRSDLGSESPLQFLVIVFLLSLPFWLFGAFVSSEILPGLPVSSLMVVCPVSAAAFLVWRAGGGGAVVDFFRDAFTLKMRLWVFLIALGTMPLVTLLSGVALFLIGESLPAPSFNLVQLLGLFVMFMLAATAEELGWTAYLSRPLVSSYGFIVAGIIIGVVAVVWHVIPLLQADREFGWIAWWAVGTMCRRMLILWLYVRGGQKVIAATLFHAMNNVSWMMFPVLGSHYDPAPIAIILLLPVLVVAVTNGNSREMGSPQTLSGA